MLKDKTSRFERVREVYSLKFKHHELAIGGDSKSLGQYLNQFIKGSFIGFVKK